MRCGICLHPLQEQWDDVKRQVQELAASSQYSNQPAIYGMVAGAEAARLRGEVPGEGEWLTGRVCRLGLIHVWSLELCKGYCIQPVHMLVAGAEPRYVTCVTAVLSCYCKKLVGPQELAAAVIDVHLGSLQ